MEVVDCSLAGQSHWIGRHRFAGATFDRVASCGGMQQRVSGVTFLDSLPRNPNGKILKRELRAEDARHRADQ